MARTKGDPENKGAARRASYRAQNEFVRFTLTDEQKTSIKALDFIESDLVEALLDLEHSGYKVTFRYDDYGDCSGCWFIAPDKDSDNTGLILAGRGSSPLKAFKQAYWMHTVWFDGLWPKPSGNTKQELDD